MACHGENSTGGHGGGPTLMTGLTPDQIGDVSACVLQTLSAHK